ncbi:MAG TPA: flagellar hook-basal body protein [Thermoguttaceae bacterium]|nr:flagellar hook-basal body protein [Thermoguttaceae bacterium]
MPNAFYISAEGAHAQSTRLDVIANNLANVDTVAFKRKLAVFQARYAEAIEEGSAVPGSGSADDVGGGTMVLQTVTDYSPGPVKRTGIRTDVAIRDAGVFFQVRKEVGGQVEDFLTRAGNFEINANGQLTTQQGHLVLDDAEAPIVIQDPDWRIDDAGVVWKREGIQRLSLVQPESLGDLVSVGENLFKPLAESPPVLPAERKVAAGYLEMSSVQPTTEMVELIQTSRALEANINMMKAQDQMLDGLVNRVMRA